MNVDDEGPASIIGKLQASKQKKKPAISAAEQKSPLDPLDLGDLITKNNGQDVDL